MFPAQALSEELLRLGHSVKLCTDPRGARYTQNFSAEIEQIVTRSATFARGDALSKFAAPFAIGFGTLSAMMRMIVDRPRAVVGFGGYPSIPALAAAMILRIPRYLHEQNGVLGRVNQVFAARVNKVACGVPLTEPPRGVKTVHLGNPVRSAILERAGADYIPPGDYPMSIVILGGSQGARILSDVVPAAIVGLPSDLQNHLRIFHQARSEDETRVREFYQSHNIRAEVRPFFDNIPQLFADAQLVISRAGASTIADLAVIGRPSILVPLAASVRDEQTANAQMLVAAGAAQMMREEAFTKEALIDKISGFLYEPAKASAMASAALACAKPDAARDLAQLILN